VDLARVVNKGSQEVETRLQDAVKTAKALDEHDFGLRE
jgi:hypothetical protein